MNFRGQTFRLNDLEVVFGLVPNLPQLRTLQGLGIQSFGCHRIHFPQISTIQMMIYLLIYVFSKHSHNVCCINFQQFHQNSIKLSYDMIKRFARHWTWTLLTIAGDQNTQYKSYYMTDFWIVKATISCSGSKIIEKTVLRSTMWVWVFKSRTLGMFFKIYQ